MVTDSKINKIDRLFDEFINEVENLPKDVKSNYYKKISKSIELVGDKKEQLTNEDLRVIYKSYILQSLNEKIDLRKFDINLNQLTSIHNDSIDVLREISPNHNSKVLIILGWAGNIKDRKLNIVTDLNIVLRKQLLKNNCNDCGFKDKIDSNYTISELLSCIIGNHKLTDIVEKYIAFADNLIEDYESYFEGIDVTEKAVMEWKSQLNELDIPYNYDILPLIEVEDSLESHVILGVKLQHMWGFPFTSKEKTSNYDPFMVFQFSSNFKKIIGVQGLLVPVDLRNESSQMQIKQAIRNAIARVMARNMSHNIGSHVLSKLVQPNIVDYENIVSNRMSNYTSFLEKSKNESKNKRFQESNNKEISKRSYYNDLIATFFSYLKTRQDLLADIVTTTPQVQTTKYFISDMMENLDKNRLLLNRISGIEDFEYKFSLEGILKKKKGKGQTTDTVEFNDIPVAISNDVIGMHAFYIILENIIRNSAKHNARNYKNTNTSIEPRIFTIKVNDCNYDNSLYEVLIHDDIKVTGSVVIKIPKSKLVPEKKRVYSDDEKTFSKSYKIYEIAREHTAYYEGAIADKKIKNNDPAIYLFTNGTHDYFKIKKIDNLVIKQNIWICSPVINRSNFDLRMNAQGLMEMETCAAYLRRVGIEEIEKDNFIENISINSIYFENFLEPINTSKNKKLQLLFATRPLSRNGIFKNNLAYRFYMHKPKELLILDFDGQLFKYCKKNKFPSSDQPILSELNRYGISIYSAKELYKTTKENVFDSDKTYQHEQLLIVGNNENLELIQSKVPKRKLTCKEFSSHYCSFNSIEEIHPFSLLTRLIERPDELKLEVLRATIRKKFIEKNLRPENNLIFGNYVKLSNNLPIYPISLYVHGSEYRGNTNKDYVEIYESRFNSLKTTIYLTQKSNPSIQEIEKKIKFLDTILTNYLILDERIQEQSEIEYSLGDNTEYNSLPYQYIWDQTNVYIPQKSEINLSTNDVTTNFTKKIKKIISNQFGKESKRRCKGLDYLIIHLGIVERVLNSMEIDCNDNENKLQLIKKILEESDNTKIIFTSGRSPNNLPPNTSFLSYSTLSQYLIENRFKYHFNEVINSLRQKS